MAGVFCVRSVLLSTCVDGSALHFVARRYARKAAAAVASGTLTLQTQKKKLPVETDPVKLTAYCCGSNILKEGSDVKLGPDSDYPDWLWKMELDKAPDLREMDPNTAEYWETLHRYALYHQNKLLSKRPMPELRINEKEKMKKLKAILHRALAASFYDPGVPVDQHEKDKQRRKLN